MQTLPEKREWKYSFIHLQVSITLWPKPDKDSEKKYYTPILVPKIDAKY